MCREEFPTYDPYFTGITQNIPFSGKCQKPFKPAFLLTGSGKNYYNPSNSSISQREEFFPVTDEQLDNLYIRTGQTGDMAVGLQRCDNPASRDNNPKVR